MSFKLHPRNYHIGHPCIKKRTLLFTEKAWKSMPPNENRSDWFQPYKTERTGGDRT